MSVLRSAAATLSLAGWLCACGRDAIGPPSDAIRFTPPVKFRLYWALTEACSGHTGDFDAVRWYVLPSADSFQLEGQTVGAAWYGDGNRIVFGAGQQDFSGLVRHEMLHALLRVGGHPRDQFLDRCGDIVDCFGRCITDAGGPPAFSTTAPIVAPSSLTVTTLVATNPVSLSADSGWLPLTVSVTNHAPYAVQGQVPLPPDGQPPGFSFAYRIASFGAGPSSGDGYAGLDGTLFPFAPAGTAGATRRFVFGDRPILVIKGMSAGDYNAVGSFLGVASVPVVLQVLR